MTSTMEWIRRTYDVPARHRMRIEYDGKPATIVGTRGPHLAFRIDGEKHITISHPCYRIVYPAIPEPTRPRGWCAHCLKDRAMKDGVMGRHQWYGRNWSELCPGSGQPPWKPVRNLTHPGEQRPEPVR
ncbi:hypothetical protein [Streptomyces reticuli]|uniref:hypothetical protein n=1 Tax=Streptomyces reticuli TaxID=1926 RepID=UPI00073DF93B|nr:hypothetical protein [Streptomyces sp. SID7810]CUW31716.1 hypothetical protein TUE45_06465 [Streptomyces reticuli]